MRFSRRNSRCQIRISKTVIIDEQKANTQTHHNNKPSLHRYMKNNNNNEEKKIFKYLYIHKINGHIVHCRTRTSSPSYTNDEH